MALNFLLCRAAVLCSLQNWRDPYAVQCYRVHTFVNILQFFSFLELKLKFKVWSSFHEHLLNLAFSATCLLLTIIIRMSLQWVWMFLLMLSTSVCILFILFPAINAIKMSTTNTRFLMEKQNKLKPQPVPQLRDIIFPWYSKLLLGKQLIEVACTMCIIKEVIYIVHTQRS